ncbi:Part of AAA domain-containing protein [Amycolatopsis lurida]|nr:DEAD/DEAH box helicase [Amycolatopsis lurida]SEC39117.1 Part of AAA domain-containing protein [Amycolatopsis lurida]
MAGDPRAAQVVRFWRAVETFSPQSAPRPTRNRRQGADEIVLDLAADDIAPWDQRHWIAKAALPKGKVWQFSVYGGIYGLPAAREALAAVFGRENNEFVERDDSDTAMFAFTLDAEGYLVEDSPCLSACAWAISRLQKPGPDAPGWLEGFKTEEKAFVAALNRLAPPKPVRSGSRGNGFAAKAGKAVLGQLKGAAADAVTTGAKATGDAVKVTTAAALTTVAGPLIGGIAGAAAGTFVEKLLTPPAPKPESATAATGATSDQQTTEPPLSEPPLMTPQLVHAFVSRLGAALDVTDLLKVEGVRVKCVQVHQRTADEASEQNFLNSFISDDLLRIEAAVRDGDVGPGIDSYLADTASIPVGNRIDVRSFPETVVGKVAPKHIPGGRWPTAIDRPLAVSQQFAVNEIMGEFASASGVFAVNGPPGTGKTTMLRDVVAAVVVDRAQRIVDLRVAHPTDAFAERTDRVPLRPKYTATVHWLRPELTGSEIVVATAGNKAAANITMEIPGIDAVRGAEDAACGADYFTELASNVLGAEAWGLIAAKLGKRSNRGTFVKRFWWGDQAGGGSASAPEQPAPIKGMKEILEDAAARPLTADIWAESVRRFKQVRAEVDELTAQRQQAADVIDRLVPRKAGLVDLRATVDAARTATAHHTAALAEANAKLVVVEKKAADAGEACDEHAARQPNFWVSLSTFFRAGREWDTKRRKLDRALDDAKAAVEAVRSTVAIHRAAVGEASTAQRRHEVRLQKTLHEIAALENQLAQARARWPERLPYRADFATDEEFQLCTPWADAAYTEARNRLFLEALRLHKTFILGAEPRLKDNLDVAMAMLREGLRMPAETLRMVWQSFFLVVPVVSTTFASLPHLFRGLERETFGWLFIDEAGQATPQQALGGIWRARRSVIVGDPQQLKPIVPLPLSAQHALRRNHRVDEQWTPENASVQRLADRSARFGTSLPEPDGNGRVWVGAPLRVHRRCERLMFGISNDIAYGGDLMIYGTQVKGDYPGHSAWIDVRGPSSDNWVPEEGKALAHLLDELKRDGIAPEEIRVISPFRDTVRGATGVSSNRLGWTFARENVGTVHTVQGQESNVIILVLGSAPRKVRAREWAAETPNLLNVAVSRAKRRIYVIGNRGLWREQRFFETLAARLSVRAWPMDDLPDNVHRTF